jgi:hypothetical protein
MGCDIHDFIEVRQDGEWKYRSPGPFQEGRSCALFGWLADVRNYSAVPPLDQPRGLPSDLSGEVAKEHEEWGPDAHSASWLMLSQLASFDFDALVEDRRVTVQVSPNLWNGGATAEPGGGEMMTYREFLGSWVVDRIEAMRVYGDATDVRLVFWFDN